MQVNPPKLFLTGVAMNPMEPLENVIQTLSQKGYCCSQILALLILGAQDRENPDLVRSLGGLCHGIGQSGDACGILTGGCCVIAYLLGGDGDNVKPAPEAKIVQEDFVDWFKEVCDQKWGSIHCSVIIDEDNPKGPDKSHCKVLLANSWIRLLGILTQHNIAYAARRGKNNKISAEICA